MAGLSSHGGYCGPAVKPIALHMLARLSRSEDFDLPVSGIGGITNWRDAVEFMLLGASAAYFTLPEQLLAEPRIR